MSTRDVGLLFLAYRSIVQYQWDPCLVCKGDQEQLEGDGQEPSAVGGRYELGRVYGGGGSMEGLGAVVL